MESLASFLWSGESGKECWRELTRRKRLSGWRESMIAQRDILERKLTDTAISLVGAVLDANGSPSLPRAGAEKTFDHAKPDAVYAMRYEYTI